MNVRAQAGGAGTILNNLSALGVGTIYPIGFAGDDGEGFELCQAMARLPGVRQDGMVSTSERRTFTYCKPLLMDPGQPPRELNRLDSKNWTVTPKVVEAQLVERMSTLAGKVDAMIVLDQVDIPDTGVVTRTMLEAIRNISACNPSLFILADSRRGLSDFPPLVFKMNSAELGRLTGAGAELPLEGVKRAALELASRNQRMVFVTLAENGIVGANPCGEAEHLPCLPLRGPIDVVGAGDSVSANLASSVAAGASLREALEIANAGASVVVHKLGTTGTASVLEIEELLMAKSIRVSTPF
jgi:bifunctional ADP-heptose synthase (sugar kinase/adenylyltransferase)